MLVQPYRQAAGVQCSGEWVSDSFDLINIELKLSSALTYQYANY